MPMSASKTVLRPRSAISGSKARIPTDFRRSGGCLEEVPREGIRGSKSRKIIDFFEVHALKATK